MHDSVGLQLRTSLQSAKLQLANLHAKLLLLSHSENYIKLTFVVVSLKIFLVRLFCAPLPAVPAPSAPLSYVTVQNWQRAQTSCLGQIWYETVGHIII